MTLWTRPQIYEDLKLWMNTQWDINLEEAGRAVEAWKSKLGLRGNPPGWVVQFRTGEEAPTEVFTPSTPPLKEDTVEGEDDEGEDDEAEGDAGDRRKMRRLGEDREGNYVVVYRRMGRGTLHLLGKDSCWMARRRDFVKSEVYSECPPEEVYSTRCKLCWRTKGWTAESESTSDSRDDVDLTDIES